MSAVEGEAVEKESAVMVTADSRDGNTAIPVSALPAHINMLKSTKKGFKNEFAVSIYFFRIPCYMSACITAFFVKTCSIN